MSKLKRFIRNWLGITEGSYPHRIVSMMYFQDKILAVDGLGDIYELNAYDPAGPYVQLLMQNPLER